MGSLLEVDIDGGIVHGSALRYQVIGTVHRLILMIGPLPPLITPLRLVISRSSLGRSLSSSYVIQVFPRLGVLFVMMYFLGH